MIGVYEPLVVSADGGERTTSLAAEPDLPPLGHALYHGGCFALIRGRR